jgi:hypothetical protein
MQMSKAIILILLFLIISCHNSNMTSRKIQKGEHIIIESILKSYNINGARARLDIYRDSLKLKLQLPILPIDILDLRINNSNIFIKQLGKEQDTIETSAISPHFKVHHLNKLILKKKPPLNPIIYNNKSIFISIYNYTHVNNIYVPHKIRYSTFPFIDTLDVQLEYKSVILSQ